MTDEMIIEIVPRLADLHGQFLAPVFLYFYDTKRLMVTFRNPSVIENLLKEASAPDTADANIFLRDGQPYFESTWLLELKAMCEKDRSNLQDWCSMATERALNRLKENRNNLDA